MSYGPIRAIAYGFSLALFSRANWKMASTGIVLQLSIASRNQSTLAMAISNAIALQTAESYGLPDYWG